VVCLPESAVRTGRTAKKLECSGFGLEAQEGISSFFNAGAGGIALLRAVPHFVFELSGRFPRGEGESCHR
jgi:hypothetical protein